MMIYVKARAKLNAGLNITGKRGNMHLLDSVMLPVYDIFDEVEIGERGDGEIKAVYSDGRRYADDSAVRAAELYQAAYGVPGVDIFIKKYIPEGAGLGGSSADGAAVLRGMERLFGKKVTPEILLETGSDAAMQYYDLPCRITGAGERAEFIEKKSEYYGVMLFSGKVDTSAAFKKYDEVGGNNGETAVLLSQLEKGEEIEPFNALIEAAISLLPEIRENMEILRKAGFDAGMTGSGGGVFGLERDEDTFLKKLDCLKKAVKYTVFKC